METQGPYLNCSALLSPLGVLRSLQILFGCVTLSLVAHDGGYGAAYGHFCMFAWAWCLTLSGLIVSFELARLQSCVRLSWENFTISFAMLAVLMELTASVVYPVYFVQLDCGGHSCESRDFRISASVFSGLTCIAYGVEVQLSRAKPGHIGAYMATTPGLLKVVQAYVACIIFGALANGSEYSRYPATQWCVGVYSVCFILTSLVIGFNVSGRTGALRCPFDRLVVLYTFLATLLYLSAAVVWPIFCFDSKYGSVERPPSCSLGDCPWDSQLIITIFTFINLILYLADLIYSQRLRYIPEP
ncbi:myeloid-associated differentiation marker-like protein 2 isoform X1 [Stegostoma tigrinum]|uniref:myeloid-associated differentiation marker-like protein 2 isoform X1 n=1 Tax=Stegostoma tigrinum TaxID=3053191 RepID=UPI00202AF668|nr:myeloid-associated differentiation marker-like protein 2 isoform X1 [Stegostoma tigrinum]